MYGGVSLSIYMNGVAQEMFHLVRATAASQPSGPEAIPDGGLVGSELVYRSLGQIDPDDLGAPFPERTSPVTRRFVIDVLSGTSAGGINAVFLAKALANHQRMAGLTNLWLEEGDLGKLMNDPGSDSPGLRREQPPESLLNSGRMFVRLLDAFDSMDRTDPWSSERPSTLAEAVDLFVTTTDLYGFELPIRLANALSTERRYRNVYHLAYSGADLRPGDEEQDAAANPFVRDHNPFLAFACRCTSAFPLAFKPMMLRDIDDLVAAVPGYEGRTSATAGWRAFYPDYAAAAPNPAGVAPLAFADRPFADGGALDNKPFGYAVDILRTRRAQVPVDRKLVFVEPDPSPPASRRDPAVRPDALRNFLDQGILLPRQETIRDDLSRVDDLNRLARRVDGALREVIAHIEVPDHRTAPVTIERTPGAVLDRTTAQVVDDRSAGYQGYLALRDEAVIEDLAALIAGAVRIPTSREYLVAIRALLKAWRDVRYSEGTGTPLSLGRFLWTFDHLYRRRRLGFLERRTDTVYRGDADGRALLARFGVGPEVDPRSLRSPLTFVKQGVARATQTLVGAEGDLRSRGDMNPLPGLIRDSGIDLAALGRILERTSDAGRADAARGIVDDHLEAIDRVLFTVSAGRTQAATVAFDALAGGLERAASSEFGDGGRIAAAVAAWAYARFDEFDMVAFPLQYGSDAGEGDQVEVVRISPGDATSLVSVPPGATLPGSDKPMDGAGKVTGARVNHFGAFLDRLWRENDIMWGRLDAAEILIDTLVPSPPGQDEQRAAVVSRLRNEAFVAILREELQREDVAKLFSVADAARRDGVELDGRLRDLVEAAEPDANAVVGAFQASYRRPTSLQPGEGLSDVGRAADVAGRVMGGIAGLRGEAKPPLPFALAARLGQLVAAVLGAAVPTSAVHRRARLGFLLLYLAETVAIVVGSATGVSLVVRLAVAFAVATGLANVALWLIAGRLRMGRVTASPLWIAAVIALAALVGIVLGLAVAQVVRTAGDHPWAPWGSLVAVAAVGAGVVLRRPKAGVPRPRALRRAGLALTALGLAWVLVLAGLELKHLATTRDWIPFVAGPPPDSR
jgi:patatin-related protein